MKDIKVTKLILYQHTLADWKFPTHSPQPHSLLIPTPSNSICIHFPTYIFRISKVVKVQNLAVNLPKVFHLGL